ncbi:hypothetical protein [Pseudoduganella lurida]|uniref:hypothetical protein n=1 Tax=Pseudoduganella lurida TaxID=1036180 RepID=UPI0011A6D399|nr:hypothetical protein [Pseudoduganella lurida]
MILRPLVSMLHPSIITATAWRREHGFEARGGIVVVGVAGICWMDRLRNPERWEPGAVAVDALGHAWIAMGGDRDDGAMAWMPTNTAAWRRTAQASRSSP